MSILDELRLTADSDMKAIIIYDDFALAAQANSQLQRAGHCADVNIHWDIIPWRLNALKVHTLSEEALKDAADAQLIMLAGRCAEPFPSWLREWLTRWANIRQTPNAALAIIEGANGGLSRLATSELSQFVRQHGLTFIIDEGPVAKDAVKLFTHHARECELPVPVRRPRFEIVTRDSCRGWGIND